MGVTDWQMKTKDPIAERCLRPESDEGQGVAGRAEGSGMESKGSFSNCTPSSTLSYPFHFIVSLSWLFPRRRPPWRATSSHTFPRACRPHSVSPILALDITPP